MENGEALFVDWVAGAHGPFTHTLRVAALCAAMRCCVLLSLATAALRVAALRVAALRVAVRTQESFYQHSAATRSAVYV